MERRERLNKSLEWALPDMPSIASERKDTRTQTHTEKGPSEDKEEMAICK